MNLQLLLMIYGAWLLTIILHEIGHLPSKFKINIGLFKMPYGEGVGIRLILPEGASFAARSRYGGLLVTFIILYTIYKLQPTNEFLQILGLINFVYIILYLIWGSFNYEPQIPDFMKQFFIIDDIPNELWYVAVPIGAIVFYYFRVYYIPILISVIGGLL